VILRLALRSLTTRPVRSAVLAGGFGFGISVMAALLGVAEVILEQARSPAQAGGGDVVASGAAGSLPNARFVLGGVIGAPPLAERIRAASPWRREVLYLVEGGEATPIEARGGIPSRERALGDPETALLSTWADLPADRPWAAPDPGELLRAMDRFHPIPEVPARSSSWAEWLYFNGRSAGEDGARFYLTFLSGPRTAPGRRSALVRLQLERGGRTEAFSLRSEVEEEDLLQRAPDLDIGLNQVRLSGLRYRVRLQLAAEEPDGRKAGAAGVAAGRAGLSGELTLEATPGRSLPPFAIRGAGGWVSGYTVPILVGRLDGRLDVEGEAISFAGGTGYHDHNWGFWQGVSWQWGQVALGELSLVYGRVRPPADAADPERLPGFLAVLGPEGPLGIATAITIEETDEPGGDRPRTITVRARGEAIDLALSVEVRQVERTRPGAAPPGTAARSDFLQLRGLFRVEGTVGERRVSFVAPGAAETFRAGDG
jgi:hypothetical protein